MLLRLNRVFGFPLRSLQEGAFVWQLLSIIVSPMGERTCSSGSFTCRLLSLLDLVSFCDRDDLLKKTFHRRHSTFCVRHVLPRGFKAPLFLLLKRLDFNQIRALKMCKSGWKRCGCSLPGVVLSLAQGGCRNGGMAIKHSWSFGDWRLELIPKWTKTKTSSPVWAKSKSCSVSLLHVRWSVNGLMLTVFKRR